MKLTHQEEQQLERFSENKNMVEAVRKTLLNQLEDPVRAYFPDHTYIDSKGNADLGAQLRAIVEAANLVKTGFKKIENLGKKPKPEQKRSNPAI